MTHSEQRVGSKKLRDEAARLFIDLRTGPGDEARRVLSDWLLISPDHITAYLEVAQTSGVLHEASEQLDWSVEAFVAAVVEGPENSTVVPLGRNTTEFDQRRHATKGNTKSVVYRWLSIAAGLIVVLGGILLWGGATFDSGDTYSTDIGEQRSFTLNDGSTIHLNTRSELRVRFDANVRHIDLVRGEALFIVARDPVRPFEVHGGETIFSALGTRFNVRLWDDRAMVTVLEGRVGVATDLSVLKPKELAIDKRQDTEEAMDFTRVTVNAEPIELGAGEQASIVGAAIEQLASVNPAQATAWTSRRLIFTAEPLATVLDEFNRYNRQSIRVQDPELSALEISGTFDPSDVDSLLESLKTIRQIEVVREASGTRLVRPQS